MKPISTEVDGAELTALVVESIAGDYFCQASIRGPCSMNMPSTSNLILAAATYWGCSLYCTIVGAIA